MTEPDLRVLSLGLGTQSSALALMSAAGQLPRLDHVVFADTQGDGGAFNARGNQPFAGRMFLHGSTIPLRTADLRTAAQIKAGEGQAGLFDEDALAADCDAGVCFT